MAIKPIEILIKAKDEASGIFGSLQSKVAGVGVAIAGYFGISAFVGAVKGAADLQAKLSEVEAVSGATAAEMVLLRKAAEEAGATTKFTATEGAQALGNLARAGLSAKDAIATLPAVLNLAQAGNIGLAEASEYVTKAVMGLGLEFADAGRVADVLAKGANASNTSVTGLAQALSYTAPIAKSVGLGLETTVAIIGKFADAGIDASRAGTALNAILSQFADPASKFRQELAGAGITTNNFEAALHQLAAAGPAGQKAILAVGTEAGPALRALLNQGMGALDDLKGKLDNAAGSAAATAKVMQANLDGAMLSLGSTWESVRIALATPVLPALQSGVEKLTSALRSAVSDGTIGKFGEAIATAFQAGIKWAQEFFGTIDFAALTTRMQAFADEAKNTFTQLGEYASNAGNIVKTVYGVMSAGTNVVLASIYGIGVAFSEAAAYILTVSIKINEHLQKIAIGDAKTRLINETQEMRIALIGLDGVSTELSQHMKDAMSGAVVSAQLARDGITGLTSVTQTASTQAAASVKAWNDLSDAERLAANEAKLATINIKELTAAEQVSANEAKIAAFKKKDAADTVQAAIAALKKEYEAALATGNWQLAAEKILEIKKVSVSAKDAVTEQRKKAEEDAKLIAAAFADVGIKTKTELTNLANNAKTNFELIKSSGQATADGLQTAFKNYAEKAIAASGAVGSEQRAVTEEVLKSKGAVEGLSVTFDATGKMVVQTQAEAAAAIAKTTGSLAGQKDALNDVTSALERQNAAQERANAAVEKAIELENKRLNQDKEGYTLNTAGQRIEAQGNTERSVYEGAKSQGLTDAQALQISNQFIQNGQQVGYGAANASAGENWATELQKAIDKLVLQNASKNAGTGGGTSTGPTYISNINIPGVGSVTATFLDSGSQQGTEDLFRKLAQAKGASI